MCPFLWDQPGLSSAVRARDPRGEANRAVMCETLGGCLVAGLVKEVDLREFHILSLRQRRVYVPGGQITSLVLLTMQIDPHRRLAELIANENYKKTFLST